MEYSLERSYPLERKALNEQERSIDLSFSSESGVLRWFPEGVMPEVLLHGKDNVDLSRLDATGAALLNHRADFIVGPILSSRIQAKTGRAVMAFDDDEQGNYAMAKVKSGSLKGVSVRGTIQEYRELKEGETYRGHTGPAMLATRWTPYEISLTPIPADIGVGVGRSLDGIKIERSTTTTQEESAMEDKEIKELIRSAVTEATANIPKVEDIAAKVVETLREQAKPRMGMELERAQDLTGRAAAISPEAENEISRLIFQGKSEAEVSRKLVELATGKPDADGKKPNGDGSGLDDGDTARAVNMDKIEDDDLIRSLTNPGYPLN